MHYPRHYGQTPAGLHAYVKEQTGAFEACVRAHDARRCAYLYELLDKTYGDVFFHCDQIIRGLYEPFVRDWHAAFGAEGLLVLKVEDLLDAPQPTRRKLLSFLGLPGASAPAAGAEALDRLPATGYRALHAHSLRDARAQGPMRNDTRALAEAFYRPHNLALAALLGWPKASAWATSTVIDAAGLAAPPGR